MEIEYRYVASDLHRKGMKLFAIIAEPAAVYPKIHSTKRE
jgi:hypothetical protein